MIRILVVEDEPGIAFGLESDLKMEGYAVELVEDGTTGARLAREGKFDLILLDVMLPGKDGFEICRELRSAGVRTPVILVTARTHEAEKVMGLEVGADDYVTKPFSHRELRPNLRTFSFPRWAPDGRSFVSHGTDSQGRQGIYRIDAQTGNVVPVTISPQGSGSWRPQWSPDGQRIFYHRSFENPLGAAFLERELATGSERELFRGGMEDMAVSSVSPDGRYLCTLNPRKGTALLLMPTAGGEPRELLRANYPQRISPVSTWTPDSGGVIVTKVIPGEGRGEVWLVPVANGQPRKLDLDTPGIQWTQFRVNPDGRRIAYVAGERKVEVWVLENFLPAK